MPDVAGFFSAEALGRAGTCLWVKSCSELFGGYRFVIVWNSDSWFEWMNEDCWCKIKQINHQRAKLLLSLWWKVPLLFLRLGWVDSSLWSNLCCPYMMKWLRGLWERCAESAMSCLWGGYFLSSCSSKRSRRDIRGFDRCVDMGAHLHLRAFSRLNWEQILFSGFSGWFFAIFPPWILSYSFQKDDLAQTANAPGFKSMK